jgi:hypothetical protein
VTASLIIRKLASYPRQNSLHIALREVGRIERSLFMLEWMKDPELRRRVVAPASICSSCASSTRSKNRIYAPFAAAGTSFTKCTEEPLSGAGFQNYLACFKIIWRTQRQLVPMTRLSRAASTTALETR